MNVDGNGNENRNPDYERAFGDKALMKATSTKVLPDGKINIILYWKSVSGVVGYNLYRRSIDDREMPDEPLNGDKLIGPVKDGKTLKSIVPVRSTEWKLLQNAFTILRDQASDTSNRRVDPAKAVERGLTPKEEEVFDSLAFTNFRIRLAKGLGFIDSNVKKDKWYVYELRGVKASDSEILLTKEVTVQAGHFLLLDPPSDIRLITGDHKVLALWNRNIHAHSYSVRRSESLASGYQIINDQPIIFDVKSDLDGNAIDPRPGFLDFQRWSEEGLPTSHIVNGRSINGPENYVEYYYQVASVDILGRVGKWSGVYSATPVDKTPPMSPRDLRVDASSHPPGLALSWRKVTKDIEGHIETEPPHTYRIYRSKTSDDLEPTDTLSNYLVHYFPEDPTDPNTMMLGWLDTNPVIFPQYGEQDIWYRVCCEDAHGNLSAPSALIRGKVPDRTPPGPTKVVGSEGHAKYIRILWAPNPEPDLAGYQIYRTICDKGAPYRPKDDEKKIMETCDFALIGEILLEEAEKRLSDVGSVY